MAVWRDTLQEARHTTCAVRLNQLAQCLWLWTLGGTTLEDNHIHVTWPWINANRVCVVCKPQALASPRNWPSVLTTAILSRHSFCATSWAALSLAHIDPVDRILRLERFSLSLSFLFTQPNYLTRGTTKVMTQMSKATRSRWTTKRKRKRGEETETLAVNVVGAQPIIRHTDGHTPVGEAIRLRRTSSCL